VLAGHLSAFLSNAIKNGPLGPVLKTHLERLTTAGFFPCRRCAATSLRIKKIDDVFQAETVLGQQSAQLGFKFDFLF
jgi:hypothetical protein